MAFFTYARVVGRRSRAMLVTLTLSAAAYASSLRAAEVSPSAGEPVKLLQRYPTELTTGNTTTGRSWELTSNDVFRVTQFRWALADKLRIETGPADLGVGHCSDGAVCAVVIPRERGVLVSATEDTEEPIAHIWLRFHPGQIERLFPSGTVSSNGDPKQLARIRSIANFKFGSSWHSGADAIIPEPKEMTVDVDTTNQVRRFYAVDTEAKTARYVREFENRVVPSPTEVSAADLEEAFDRLCEAFDRRYAMFVLRPELDWPEHTERYRPKVVACQSNIELAEVFAEMLKPLRDLHVWLRVAGQNVPVYNPPRVANSNPAAHRGLLGSLNHTGRRVQWAITPDQIGFISIAQWDDPEIPVQIDETLEQMRGTRGLILDVRLNGGGSEDLAREVAGRFLKQDFVYAFSQFRKGAAHDDLTEKMPRTASPRGPWRYHRPVVVLIGRKCMSSNESFVAMLTGDPDATTMGDRTCGSSGNPRVVQLPADLTVSVPQWIDYLPDGKPLDEQGVQPQVPLAVKPEGLSGARDDLLTAALERLRKCPLPEKPIAGPAYQSEDQMEAQDETRPKVVSVVPPVGAGSVAPRTELKIRFDRPMAPLALKLDWKAGGFLEVEYPKYNAETHEFTIPVQMVPGSLQTITLNAPMMGIGKLSEERAKYPRDGFQSADHRLARLFTWSFQTKPGAKKGTSKPPTLVKTSPASGAEVPYRTWMELQFDQPMKSLSEAMPYLVAPSPFKRPAAIASLQYDSATRTFRFPLLLPPEGIIQFTVDGLQSAGGAACKPIAVEYDVTAEDLSSADRERLAAQAQSPKLLAVLETLRQQRAKVTSIAERIQVLSLHQHDGVFNRLVGQAASFKWQAPDRYFGDVTDVMLSCSAFKMGSDGRDWWWHTGSGRGNKLIVCPTKEMHELNLAFCDPFGLSRRDAAKAASELALSYLGTNWLGQTLCHLFEGWEIQPLQGMAPAGTLKQWWVDSQTGFPLEVRQAGDQFVFRTRFFYDSVNQPLAKEDFAMPKVPGLSPAPPDKLDGDYTKRFISLRDGSDGRMSVRWGKKGPKGTSSGGLN